MKLLFTTVLIVLAVGSNGQGSPQTRANCDALTGITNPCTGTEKIGYYPHPSDNTKFLQCGGGRMFLVQCPTGEVYSQDARTCLPPVKQTTALPAVTISSGTQVSNPCSPQNLATGSVYFPVPGNKHKFIECSPDGSANLLDCPSLLEWDQTRQSCVYSSQTQTQQPTQDPNTLTGSGVDKNPCLGQTVTNAGLFFSHPDPSKFIQCDVAGNAFVLPCPPGLVWNEYSTTCVSPYLVYSPTIPSLV
ncbi:probable endochitinase [Ylistrum balloti]|uniref:probable endochitinase n=1 Tax=Ylistrum balloti TaxID=509963 RepID=UPI002905ADDF|nr:probable endochitinase [Ylistrum balloti]